MVGRWALSGGIERRELDAAQQWIASLRSEIE